MIKSKNNANKPLITQLWFERTDKVLQQLQYTLKLLDFFDYAAVISHRFKHEYIPSLKNQQQLTSIGSSKLIKEMKAFIEVNYVQQMEYDYFNYKNESTYSYFIVRTDKDNTYRKTLNKKHKRLRTKLTQRRKEQMQKNANKVRYRDSDLLVKQQEEEKTQEDNSYLH